MTLSVLYTNSKNETKVNTYTFNTATNPLNQVISMARYQGGRGFKAVQFWHSDLAVAKPEWAN